jgi:hypothetical protein
MVRFWGARKMAGEGQFTAWLCWLKVVGAAGIAFLALAGASDNLVKYLFGPGWMWIIGGSVLAAWWAYQSYCIEDADQ